MWLVYSIVVAFGAGNEGSFAVTMADRWVDTLCTLAAFPLLHRYFTPSSPTSLIEFFIFKIFEGKSSIHWLVCVFVDHSFGGLAQKQDKVGGNIMCVMSPH